MIRPPELVPSATPIPWWLAMIVILGAALAAAGGIIAIVRPEILLEPGEVMNAAATVYAGYLVSRGLAVAIMLLTLLAFRASRALAVMMVFTALIQLIDAIVDATEGRYFLLPILVLYVVAFLYAANRLGRQAFWKTVAA
jgi:hypothetical protein